MSEIPEKFMGLDYQEMQITKDVMNLYKQAQNSGTIYPYSDSSKTKYVYVPIKDAISAIDTTGASHSFDIRIITSLESIDLGV